MIKKIFVGSIVGLWLCWCALVFIFHIGTLTPPIILDKSEATATFIEKTEQEPLQHLILSGSPYGRGVKAGQLTKHLLAQQEKELTTMVESLFKSQKLFLLFEIAIIPFFKGVDKNIPEDYLHEMYGVSQSTAPEFDNYADPYTRQLAYHGLHEVGQQFVDYYKDDRLENMGCTAFVTPHKNSWIIGRNFDFEGTPTLDEKKILKWVFPNQKYAYVSVIWAGMVGGVTAVNEHGLYLSINAAGTKTFERHGLPSTLLLTKIMDSAKTAEEAIAIFKNTQTMITEIFVMMDTTNNTVFRIEKSPEHTEVIPLTEPSAVTNHLHSVYWSSDTVNAYRRDNLTSLDRETRGLELIKSFPKNSLTPEDDMLRLLRDKNGLGNKPLPWGHRSTIDGLIANHSVIYNGAEASLYVSSGPHLTGKYSGYDLKKSFTNRKPFFLKNLAADPDMDEGTYENYKNLNAMLKQLSTETDTAKINATHSAIESMIQKDPRLESVQWNDYLGAKHLKQKDYLMAKKHFTRALELYPSYKSDRDSLKKQLQEIETKISQPQLKAQND